MERGRDHTLLDILGDHICPPHPSEACMEVALLAEFLKIIDITASKRVYISALPSGVI